MFDFHTYLTQVAWLFLSSFSFSHPGSWGFQLASPGGFPWNSTKIVCKLHLSPFLNSLRPNSNKGGGSQFFPTITWKSQRDIQNFYCVCVCVGIYIVVASGGQKSLRKGSLLLSLYFVCRVQWPENFQGFSSLCLPSCLTGITDVLFCVWL